MALFISQGLLLVDTEAAPIGEVVVGAIVLYMPFMLFRKFELPDYSGIFITLSRLFGIVIGLF